VRASSLQGRFAEGAAAVDGRVLVRAEAYGKHLFLEHEGDLVVHVHLGLHGTFRCLARPMPAPVGALRLRLEGAEVGWDLRGATACDLLGPAGKAVIVARLGPDPLQRNADPERAWAALRRRRSSIGQGAVRPAFTHTSGLSESDPSATAGRTSRRSTRRGPGSTARPSRRGTTQSWPPATLLHRLGRRRRLPAAADDGRLLALAATCRARSTGTARFAARTSATGTSTRTAASSSSFTIAARPASISARPRFAWPMSPSGAATLASFSATNVFNLSCAATTCSSARTTPRRRVAAPRRSAHLLWRGLPPLVKIECSWPSTPTHLHVIADLELVGGVAAIHADL